MFTLTNPHFARPTEITPLNLRFLSLDIDEALWSAYRKYDRSAVTQNLLQRYLGRRFVTGKRVR